MLISLNWVRQHCPFETDETPEKVGERFSLATAEVEGVERRCDDLGRFVVGRVAEVRPIPKAKKLVEARVDAGGPELVTVVCGAPNVREGMLAPFAAPGTAVQGKTLKAATIRGVRSAGMLLSESELGISEDHEGLLELDGSLQPGTSLDTLFPDVPDTVLEIDNKSLTHRPDLWGHYGIAREFSTIYRVPLTPYPLDEGLARSDGDPGVAVSIDAGEASERCRRYCGLRIDGVRVGPSPDWLRHRLLAVGSRPINNIVDITNYVLFDLGQPLHAFDVERLRGGRIIVRMPRRGETMTLLDGREIRLDEADLLIADAGGPVALAGVMGGDGSQIHDGTTSIFLESANFDPTSVRRASLRHGRTDSSARFEKSLDPYQARLGILRAAQLILDLCPGARAVGDLQDVGFTPPEPIVVQMQPDLFARRLGCDLLEEETRDILAHLGFEVRESNDGEEAGWRITVPSWRATRDVSIAEDLVEEVGRVHGYDHIEPFAPQWPVVTPTVNERRLFERRVKTHLNLHCGLSEVYTYAMVGAAHCERFELDPDHAIKLKNFVSEEHDRLRREIVPIHLEKARDNQRFFDRFGFFEVGRVYLKEPDRLRSPELPAERTRIAGVVATPEKTDANFYRLRHFVLSLARSLEVADAEIAPSEGGPPWSHPAVAARLQVGGDDAGLFYRIHPDYLRKLELRGDVLAFDLAFDVLFEAERRHVVYEALPRFPDVPFDVSVVAPARLPVVELEQIIRAAAGSLLKCVEVFDVYRGQGIDPDKKSVSFHLVFRSDEHTLSAEEIERVQGAVTSALTEAGYPLRG